MSDFGANIFDDGPGATGRAAGKRKGKTGGNKTDGKGTASAPAEAAPPARPPESPAPMRVAEVPVDIPQRVHDDVQEVVFRQPSKAARAQQSAPEPTRKESRPEPRAERTSPEESRFRDQPARPERPRREDHGPRDRHDRPREDWPREGDHHGGHRAEERGRHRDPRDDRRADDDRRGPRPRHDERPRHEERPRRDERSRHEERPRRDERPRRPDEPAPAEREPRGSRHMAAAAPATRVALLVDLPALQAEARDQGGELAVTRLRSRLAAGLPIETAVCFVAGRGRPPHGFEVIDAGDPLTAGIRFAAKATELANRGLHLVLAPASNAMLELARLLRDGGHAIELAGFVTREDDVNPTRRLGRDCLFVP